eukprot:Hpha_TRINITY_DN10716_c0_g3::TRINITY_DN10716_c0_g3_i1::g.43477::m.43477
MPTPLYLGLFSEQNYWNHHFLPRYVEPDRLQRLGLQMLDSPHVLLWFAPSVEDAQAFPKGKPIEVRATHICFHKLAVSVVVALPDRLQTEWCGPRRPHFIVAAHEALKSAADIQGGGARVHEFSQYLINESETISLQEGPMIPAKSGVFAIFDDRLGGKVLYDSLSRAKRYSVYAQLQKSGGKRGPHQKDVDGGDFGKSADAQQATAFYKDLMALGSGTRPSPRQLAKTFPSKNMHGRDLTLWPPQNPLLHVWAKAGWKEGVEYLVEVLGADVNLQRTKDGATPLLIAALSAVQALSSTSESVETEVENFRDILAFLVSRGARPFVMNRYGENPGELVEAFLHRAPLYLPDKQGKPRPMDWRAARNTEMPLFTKRSDSGVFGNPSNGGADRSTPVGDGGADTPSSVPGRRTHTPPTPPDTSETAAPKSHSRDTGATGRERAPSPPPTPPSEKQPPSEKKSHEVPGLQELQRMPAHEVQRLAFNRKLSAMNSKAEYIAALMRLE